MEAVRFATIDLLLPFRMESNLMSMAAKTLHTVTKIRVQHLVWAQAFLIQWRYIVLRAANSFGYHKMLDFGFGKARHRSKG